MPGLLHMDYYSILGVGKTATEAEIKSAYRKLAREWHPDVAKDKPNAAEKFKEINEAYQVLGDKEKRKQYDQFGSSAFNKGGGFNQNGAYGAGGFNPFGGGFQWSTGGSGEYENIDPFDIFEQVFGFRGFGGGARRGRSVRYNLTISFEDSIKGYEETLNVDGRKLKIKLPPGVAEGTQVKFEGMGEKSPDGNHAGDLYIVISIAHSKDFERQGYDIFSTHNISFSTAALGGKAKIKVVDPKSDTGFTEKDLKIPEGTQSETQFRLKGFGMQHPKGYGRGDHYVTIKVEVPKKLNKQQKQALKELF